MSGVHFCHAAMPRDSNAQLALLGPEHLPTTPIRRQYLELKARYPDAILFFRLGDFYETFETDAEQVAKALDIALTSREMGRGERVPMAGVPAHSAEGYVARLIEHGFRVAICEQIGEVPARGIAQRDVVRVVTPGTLVEESLLPASTDNYLAAIVMEGSAAGLAVVDVSTGRLAATELRSSAETLLAAEMVRLGPSECLVPATVDAAEDPARMRDLLPPAARATPRPQSSFSSHRAAERVQRHFDTSSLGALGLEDRPLATRCVGALLEYVDETLPTALGLIDRVEAYDIEGSMVLDASTRRGLELTVSLRSGTKQGSLLEVLDCTHTTMGARRLRRWVSSPLVERVAIESRLQAVSFLTEHGEVREPLSMMLRAMPDLERLSGRAGQRILNPRETISLADAAERLPRIRAALDDTESALLSELTERLHSFEDLVVDVRSTVADPPAANMGEGVIRAGLSPELDETRSLVGDTREWIANLETSERQRTGCRGLRVGYNRIFGYYLEVTKAQLAQPTDYYQRERTGAATVAEHLEKLGFVRRQTVANGERFVTTQLQEYEIRVRNAQEDLTRLERRLFGELLERLSTRALDLRRAADAIAQIDALFSLAETAKRNGYCRPTMTDAPILHIAEGRHPVVERALPAGAFVANDTRLGGDNGSIVILTGPNMAGKSTFLRQTALIVLLAQIGSFVPARSATIGLADRIFARVGAQDDLSANRSTFMVEMIETAAILRGATPRSLLVLDEIGRGTSTFDGIAVARAVVEHIHDSRNLRCRTLFATHYHELAELEKGLDRVRNLRVDVLEHGASVVFLHRVVEGAADKSYGVHVARLAGVPTAVTLRAATILGELERARLNGTTTHHAEPNTERPSTMAPGQVEALQRLRQADAMRMTPMQALELVSELSALAADGTD
jgi:DNA mismatch repair protein MutS